MSNIIIANQVIRQDENGLYCLNDLHRASGGIAKHKPSNWSRLAETVELIDEVKQVSDLSLAISVEHGGIGRGTYVCKELVYAYAMWISPKFHLHVIRTFDAVVMQKQAVGQDFAQGAFQDFQVTRLELVQTVGDMTEAGLRVAGLMGFDGNPARFHADKLVKKQIGIGPLELLGIDALPAAVEDLAYTPTALGKRFDVTANQFNKLLEKAKLQTPAPAGHNSLRWLPTEEGKQHSKLVETGRKHSDGAPVVQLLWKESALEVLRRAAKDMALLLRPVTRG